LAVLVFNEIFHVQVKGHAEPIPMRCQFSPGEGGELSLIVGCDKHEPLHEVGVRIIEYLVKLCASSHVPHEALLANLPGGDRPDAIRIPYESIPGFIVPYLPGSVRESLQLPS